MPATGRWPARTVSWRAQSAVGAARRPLLRRCARHDHPDDAHRGEVAYESVAELIKMLDLEDSEGNPVEASHAFEGKVVGLYFSAMHRPACQRFSKLAAFTDAQSADYVTVLVSGDANEEAFEGYRRAHVGCLAVPFRSPHRQMLMSAFRISPYPRFTCGTRRWPKPSPVGDTPPSRTTRTSACGTGTGGTGVQHVGESSGLGNCRSARPGL